MPPKRRAPAAAPTTARKPQPTAPARSKLAKAHNLTPAEEVEIREAFSLFSIPSSDHPSTTKNPPQVLRTSDVRRALIALSIPPRSPKELQTLLETLDPERNGEVEFEHFVAVAALKLRQRDGDEDAVREEVGKAWELFRRYGGGVGGGGDRKGKGRAGVGAVGGGGGEDRITVEMLRRVAKELNQEVGDDVLRDMVLEANGGAGVNAGVGRDEFESVMKRAGVFG